MKKALLTLFSVSITAGTLYLTYSQVKSFMIKKLAKSWLDESKKRSKELSEEQNEHLKKELDKLYLWEIRQLSLYSEQAIRRSPEKIILPLLNKLKGKKILEKADLKSVDTILFGT